MIKQLIIATACLIALTSCDSNSNYSRGSVSVREPNVVVTPETTNLGDNLDLQALGELVKSSANAQDIENKLNSAGSINNLDLDGDGNVDYIKVTEYGDGNNRGFSFTIDLPNNEKQEIATIDIQKNTANADMNIQGNQAIYGQPVYYHSSYSLSDLMIMHYLFAYHTPYYSPYRYGHYPSYYHSYRSVPVTSYRSSVVRTTSTSRITRTTKSSSKISSPNSSYVSKTVKTRAQTMANPTRSQKSFKVTPSNSRPSTSGFGGSRVKPTNSSSSSSYNRSSSRSSGSSFGSSSSSSNRSSSYGSSSSRSSSYGSSSRSSSRSSGFGSSSRSSSRRR